jgi:hypothetical protein
LFHHAQEKIHLWQIELAHEWNVGLQKPRLQKLTPKMMRQVTYGHPAMARGWLLVPRAGENIENERRVRSLYTRR